MPACRNLKRIRVCDRHGSRNVCLRNAILPREMIFVPKRPKKTEHQCRARKHIPKAPPQKLPSFRKCSIESNDRHASQLHPRRCSSKRSEQKEILRVQQEESRRVNNRVHLLKHQFSAKRAKKAEESRIGKD